MLIEARDVDSNHMTEAKRQFKKKKEKKRRKGQGKGRVEKSKAHFSPHVS